MVSLGEGTHCRKTFEVNKKGEVMKPLRRAALMFLVVFVGTLMVLSQSQAAESKHKINAKGIGLYTPTSGSTGETSAKIIGGGLLQGTYLGEWVTTSFVYPIVYGDWIATITTVQGATLTVDCMGTFNILTGDYSMTGDVIGATGKLEGATGILEFEGIQEVTGDPPFMAVETITGIILVDLAP